MFGIDDAALAILAAGALGTAGSIYMNKRNTAMQNYWNGMSVDLANSAHQREVADLYLAGLNPILSAGGAGASTPQLTSPKVENALAELSAAGANSAKYFSNEYAANVDQQRLLNQTLVPDAKAAELMSRPEAVQRRGMVEMGNLKAQLDQSIANIDTATRNKWEASYLKNAFRDLEDDPKLLKEYQDNLKDGILSAAKDAANVNWRHNIDAFSGAINSAANVINAGANLKSGGKAGKWTERFNRVRSLLPTGGY